MLQRRKLSDTRRAETHHVAIYDGTVGEVDAYITIGYYDDGGLGEVFLRVAKQGSTLQGTVDGWSILVSYLLQYGVPLQDIAQKFLGQGFAPAGRTSNPIIPQCSSIYDYAMKWLLLVTGGLEGLEQGGEK